MSLANRIPERHRGFTLVATGALLWSSSGLFIKVLGLSALQIASYRSLVAALAIALFMRLRRTPWKLEFDPLTLACAGTYASLIIAFVAATKLTTAANAIFLQFSAPIYLLFLEPWLFKRPFQRQDLWAVLACLGGMSLFFAGRLEAGRLLGNLLGVASGLGLALFSLLLKYKRERQPETNPIGAVVLGNLLVFLAGLPAVLQGPAPEPGQGLILVYLGMFQLGLGYVLFNAGMKYLSATAAMITSTLEAVFNPIWVFLGVGERPSPFALAGGLVILSVIVWYNLRRAPVPEPVD